MTTALIYLVVMIGVGGVLFLLASLVFGRGEELAPLPVGTTATVLPTTEVTGADVRDLRFQQALRGYKQSEVDWALDRLANEVDQLRAQLGHRAAAVPSPGPRDPEQADAPERLAPDTDHVAPDTDHRVEAAPRTTDDADDRG